MKNCKYAKIYILIMLMLPALLQAQSTWHVAPGGNDGHAGTAWTNAFATISRGVTASATDNNDVILVSNGTYFVTAHIHVNKGVTIRSWKNGDLDRDGTIVNGSGVVRCFYLQHTNAVVRGFTITNGYPPSTAYSGWGGGVLLRGGMLDDCLVTGNRSGLSGVFGGRGAGVYQDVVVHDPDSGKIALITNCVIVGNTAESTSDNRVGAGAFLEGGLITDSQINHNETIAASATHSRIAGVQLRAYSRMFNCQVISNTANRRTGVGVFGADVVISNTVIAYNHAPGENAGGLSFFNSANFKMYGGRIEYNTAGISGAGVYLYISSEVEMHGVSISYNEAGPVSGGTGGGVLSIGGTVRLFDCDINSNKVVETSGATSSGAGISVYATGSDLVYGEFHNCRIIGNELSGDGYKHGVGIRIGNNIGNVIIENCEIRGNITETTTANTRAYGGGLFISSNTVVRNTLIVDNRAFGMHHLLGGAGGGVYIDAGASNLLESCTIAGNSGRLSGGLHFAGAGEDQVLNSIVYHNTASVDNDWFFGDEGRKAYISYTCTPDADVNWGEGNITTDPEFANSGAGDYRLQSHSPCINTGLNQPDWMIDAVDLDGRARLDRFSRQVDMGCYEYVSRGTLLQVR